MASGVSNSARSHSFRPYRRFGATLSGSLARGTRDLSPASRLFPMVFSDTAGAIYARIYSLDSVLAAIPARRMRRS